MIRNGAEQPAQDGMHGQQLRMDDPDPALRWAPFPGGELEGRCPQVLCAGCRERANQNGTLCFQCYRADLERDRRLKAAGQLDTASAARFQSALPFEPVNRPRLDRLRAERATARVTLQAGSGRFLERQRRAQIAARHALQRIASAAGFGHQGVANPVSTAAPDHGIRAMQAFDAALHAAALQLPTSWLPFVIGQ